MDKRLHGDPDRIMEHAEAGYCLSHSEEMHLCRHTRSLRSTLAEKTAQVKQYKNTLSIYEKSLDDLGVMLKDKNKQVDRLRETLGKIIECNHHNFYEGPAPSYVKLAREALAETDPNSAILNCDKEEV